MQNRSPPSDAGPAFAHGSSFPNRLVPLLKLSIWSGRKSSQVSRGEMGFARHLERRPWLSEGHFSGTVAPTDRLRRL